MKPGAPGARALRAFFAWLEKNGAATVPRDAFLRALGGGPDAERALEVLGASGVVREGPPAVTLPCPETWADCAREVQSLGTSDGGVPRFLAACGRSPRACESGYVAAEALRQVSVSRADLTRALRDLLGITEGGGAGGASGGELVVVGEQAREDGTAREVVLVVRPRAEAFLDWLEARARGPRPMLVLLPTARALPADAAARHGPGAHVEVDTLSDALAIRDGALALGPRLRAVRARPAAEDERAAPPIVEKAGVPRSLPKATRWQDVRISLVDGETVSVEVGGKFARLTYVDLGLAGRNNRKPTKAWKLLVACCEEKGTFRWKPFGTFENARQVVARLRKALRATFELEDDPFHEFNHQTQWRTRFRAGEQ